MALPYLEQKAYLIGYDTPTTQDDPNSVDFAQQNPTQLAHLRFQLAETAGTKINNAVFALFCSTTNDPSTAWQVTTDGSLNMQPVEISDSTGGEPLADGIQITSPLMPNPDSYVWVNGYYIDESDSFPGITLQGNYTEVQVCIGFTGYASYGATYYFWIKQADGTDLDVYNDSVYIGIAQPYNTTQSIAWGIINTKEKNVSWRNKAGRGVDNSWAISNTDLHGFAWRHCARQTFQSAWKLFNTDLHVFSWGVKEKAAADAAWRIFHRTFDVEWRLQSTGEIVGSATGITDKFYVAEGLEEGTNYEWRVRSVENDFAGTWSSWLGFTTAADTGVLRTSTAWKLFGRDLHNHAWRVKAAGEKETAWPVFNSNRRNTAWTTGIVYQLIRDTAWRSANRQDRETAWGIRAVLRNYFLFINNIGGGMIHKFTAGLGREVRLSVVSRLSEGLFKPQKLLGSIAGVSLFKGQLYLQTIAEKDELRTYLKLVTALDDPVSLAYSVPAEVYLDGRPLSSRAYDFRIIHDEANVHNEITLQSNDPDLFDWADPARNYGSSRIEARIGTRAIQFLLEAREGERSGFTLAGRSVSAWEDAPYAEDIDFEIEEPMLASAIASLLVNHCPVQWDVEDWVVPTSFSFSGKPLDGIQQLASEVGAIVRCRDNGGLLVRRRRPTRPAQMDRAGAAVSYSGQTLISLSHSEEKESGYNAVRVFGPLSDVFAPQMRLENIKEIDGTTRGPRIGETCYVRVYWAGKLADVAGTYVTDGSISPVGFATEIVEEVVDFGNGSGSVSLPVYELISYDWIGDSGGTISYKQHSTDLSIEVSEGEDAGFGMFRAAMVKYRTRFQRYVLEEHEVERLIAVLFLIAAPEINVGVRTSADPVYGDPIEASLLTTESALVERGKAWIDRQYRKSVCDIVAPYDDLAVDGNLAYIDDPEIGAPGNYHITSSEIAIDGPKITNNLRVEKCLTSFGS